MNREIVKDTKLNRICEELLSGEKKAETCKLKNIEGFVRKKMKSLVGLVTHFSTPLITSRLFPTCLRRHLPTIRRRYYPLTIALAAQSSSQEKTARLSPVDEIRTKDDGYPSGMVDFACDADGSPFLAVSSLAVHTRDLVANLKCSLLIARDQEDRTGLRITLHGDAVLVSEKDEAAVRSAYLAKHPSAFSVDFGDFSFMRI